MYFKCDKFDALRNEYLNTWYHSGDSLQNVCDIISTNNPVLITKMSIYIKKLLKTTKTDYYSKSQHILSPSIKRNLNITIVMLEAIWIT